MNTLKSNNKSTILLSINPIHVKNIFNNSKKYEYRKKAVQGIKKIIIYETSPTMRIVGEAKVIGLLELTPDELWNQTKDHSGIDKLFFYNYFAGRSIAYAYKLGTIKRYTKPKTLEQLHIKAAPQSFAYINN